MINDVRIQKQPKCALIEEWRRKVWHVHTMEYYSSLERKAIMTHDTTWTILKNTMVCGIKQSPKDECCVIPLT
jgi:hypothetical protein